MHNYIAVVFNNSSKAYEALHALWELDHDGEITVHGTAVVHRDNLGQFQVDTKETHPALATAVGVGGAAGGAGIGAATGGVTGLVADASRADTRQQAAIETRFVLGKGQSAVIADVSEDWTAPIDDRMHSLGGTVYRRPKSAIDDDVWYDSDYYPYDYYLYPYEYVPPAYAV